MCGDRTTAAAFGVGSILAGGNAVAVRFSNRELEPLWGATLRFALAAIVLFAAMAILRPSVPRGRALTGTILYGVFNFAGAFGLAYFGLLRIQAGLGQTLLALVPLATLLLAVAERQEPLQLRAVGGALVALGGIAVMTRAPVREAAPLVSWLAMVGSAFCFAQAAVFVRRFPPVNPVAMNAVAMAIGAGLLFLGSLLAGESIALPARAATWTALLYVVVIGSVVVFLLYLVILRRWAATRAAYTFVVIPLVTVLLSTWLDREPISAALLLGGLLVLVGVYVGVLRTPTSSEGPPRGAEPAQRGPRA
jgi:drug/metabolite transporter (DMT)-like permease